MKRLSRLSRLCLVVLAVALSAVVCTSGRAAPVAVPGTDGGRQPQLVCDASGGVHVVYAQGNEIRYVRSTDGGKTFAAPTTVAQVEGLMAGMRRGPRIAVAGSTLLITAVAAKNLWSLRSTDGGKTWSAKTRVNDVDDAPREGLGNVCGLPDGGFFAVWLDLRQGQMEIWGARSADGTTWQANQQLYRTPDGPVCQCCHPSVTASATGALAVMWRNNLAGSRDLYCMTSADSGKTFGAPMKLGTGTWKLNACPMDGGAISLRADGKPVTVWRRERTVYRSSSSTDETVIGPGAQPVLALVADRPVIVWSADSAIMLLKGSAPATRLGSGTYPSLVAAPASAATGVAYAIWEGDPKSSPSLQFARIE